MIVAASIDIDVNLQSFSQFLSQQGIPHRIVEESGRQVIRVQTEQQAELIRQALTAWQSGRLDVETNPFGARNAIVEPGSAAQLLWRFWGAVGKAPVTAALSAICLLVAVLTRLGRDLELVDFLFYPTLPADSVPALLGAIDGPLVLLQTLTPMFLHFGELHIIFNLLWLWYFGRQLEVIQASWVFLLVVIITSFVGNTAQYLASQQANFGGMSGVVYGLVGYAWILHNFVPRHRLMLNNSMFAVFILMMVLMEVFASSWIASAAHAGGLLSGLLLGVLLALYSRMTRSG
ncbi:MAG: rhomboid family intramembrane serine protease [Pseudohongiellaceae bacterium]